MLMANFTFTNVKNASIGYRRLKLNYDYHLQISYTEKVDSYFKSKSADKLSAERRELMIVCQENLHHA